MSLGQLNSRTQIKFHIQRVKEQRMSSNTPSMTLGILFLIFGVGANVRAQTDGRLRQTFKGPDPSLITNLLKNKRATASPNAANAKLEVVKFKPVGDSGVIAALADALGSGPDEKSALVDAFTQIKQGYETEIAKSGKSNNLAAAMTFFISVNVIAYHQLEMPADQGEELFRSLQETMSSTSAFTMMSNQEKHQMHDWLVCMGGLVLANYMDARQKNDASAMKTVGELANYAMNIALGVDVAKLRFDANGLSMNSTTAPTATENKILGVWSKSASSPSGNMATNAGYYKGRYEFKADGTYNFKAERWFGYSRSREFYTTEEVGTYVVTGDSLTVSPKTSKTTLRNPEGVVQKTQNNQLEKVTYKWRLHYFEGLNETQLVLQAAQETTRDGGFSGNSDFPNSFLYTPGSILEWRF
jgi:hypothetical protein